jgi:hypothetical protein
MRIVLCDNKMQTDIFGQMFDFLRKIAWSVANRDLIPPHFPADDGALSVSLGECSSSNSIKMPIHFY